MVCYIAPLSHQLMLEKEKNERLEDENGLLKLKIGALEQRLNQLSKSAARPAITKGNTVAKVTPNPSQKSYLRPTVSSLNRSKPAGPVDTEKTAPPKVDIRYYKGEKGLTYMYDDGRLVDVTHLTGVHSRGFSLDQNGQRDPVRYMQDTRSSSDRKAWKNWGHGLPERPSFIDSGDCHYSNTPTLVDSHQDDTPLAEDDSYSIPSPEPKSRKEILERETRFGDCSWENVGSPFVVIPATIGYQLLSEALNLAKMAFHDFCKEHLPDLWRDGFQDGYTEVRFECDMEDAYLEYWKTPKTPYVRVFYVSEALYSARQLRNEVSHFSGKSMSGFDYDGFIEHAQKMAIAVNDAPRAAEVRALRDKLRQVAMEQLTAMENMGYASLVQVRRNWEPCQERFLRYIFKYPEGYPIHGKFTPSPALMMAAQSCIWQSKNYNSMDSDLDDEGT